MKNIILWGATGQGIVLEEFLSIIGYKVEAFFDNNANIESPVNGIPLYFGKEGFLHWISNNDYSQYSFSVAIGGWRGSDRLDIQKYLESYGLKAATVVHPSAYISRSSSISKGCQILGNSFIGAKVTLGSQVIINSSSSIDHECLISDGVHIAPGATLAGCVSVGKCSFIGTGATILPKVKIGNNVIVGAGSVVTENVPDNVIVYGNPAKISNNKLHKE